ncbi:helix-turn-helix transcriptional regulator [Halosegnis sp.]|uniref:helix-turn-helix transcriptional regulator n=1 Tax=Halosegnis sp. TaxID=2864959 RepID=UPI0035D4A4AD
MTRAAAVVLVCLLAASLVAGAAGGTAGATAARPAPLSLTQQDFDRTEFRLTVYANGSTRWMFSFTQSLENESERTAFEDYADRFNTEETELYTDFVARADQLTAQGTNATGRQMEARAFTRRAYVDEGLVGEGDERGVVRMSFLWTNFARTDGDRVVIADVFEGGFYIGPTQTLVVSHGPELAFQEAQPAPTSRSDADSLADSDSVTWEGEQSFNDNRPRIVLGPPDGTPSDGTPTDGTTPTATPTATPAGTPDLGAIPWLALVAVLLLGVAAAYVYRAGALEGGVGTDDGNGGAAGAAAPDISDEELMSDEDRVVSMLEERGGRMKQVNIVEETGWSKSKVSMLLSDMEDEGRISKLRVGRENIVSLAGEEPEAAGSPFDDDEGDG